MKMSGTDDNVIEFTPVLRDDNTEVKVPYVTTLSSDSKADCCVQSLSFVPEPELRSDDENPNMFIPVNSDFLEYNKLIEFFRQYPGDLFVTKILQEYNSCESTFDDIRGLLFESLKASEDSPVDINASLKRRMYTRNGDPVHLKLAQDIKLLISVIEGDEYSIIKNMISLSKRL